MGFIYLSKKNEIAFFPNLVLHIFISKFNLEHS